MAYEIVDWSGLSGTAFAETTVTLVSTYADTNTFETYTTTADADGKWSIEQDDVGELPPDGRFSLSVTATDSDGLVSDAATAALIFDLGTAGRDFDAPTINLNDDDGVITSGEYDSWVGLTGTAAANSTVILVSTERETGQSGTVLTQADADGNWSIAPTDEDEQPEGSFAISVTYTDNIDKISEAATTSISFDSQGHGSDNTLPDILEDDGNGSWFDRSLEVKGLELVIAGEVGGQAAVPDAWVYKVASTVELLLDNEDNNIDLTAQQNLIDTLLGTDGTWHEGMPTAQRIANGSGDDYSPNPLYSPESYEGYEPWLDRHMHNDMVWYQNTSHGDVSFTADTQINEVLEHLMHTIHVFGVRGAVDGSFVALTGNDEEVETSNRYKDQDLYQAMEEAMENKIFNPDYLDAPDHVLLKEYTYLLNFNMWEFGSEFWEDDNDDGLGSLAPEWSDVARTPEGIEEYNPLGYTLFETYFDPVLSRPDPQELRSIYSSEETQGSDDTNDADTFKVTAAGGKYFIDGEQAPVLELQSGKTYEFDLSDSSLVSPNHPLKFKLDGQTWNEGVEVTGTLGVDQIVTITVPDASEGVLSYYCENHSGMGNDINTYDVNTQNPSTDTEISGSSDSEVLEGSDGDDVISGGDGADLILAGAGNDTIIVGGSQTFSSSYQAVNTSSTTQVGTGDKVTLEGMLRVEDVIDGGADTDTIELGEGNVALFLHDAFSGFHSSVRA